MTRTKLNAKNVRNTEARKRASGLREIRVWVPDNPHAIDAVKGLAKLLSSKEAILRAKEALEEAGK